MLLLQVKSRVAAGFSPPSCASKGGSAVSPASICARETGGSRRIQLSIFPTATLSFVILALGKDRGKFSHTPHAFHQPERRENRGGEAPHRPVAGCRDWRGRQRAGRYWRHCHRGRPSLEGHGPAGLYRSSADSCRNFRRPRRCSGHGAGRPGFCRLFVWSNGQSQHRQRCCAQQSGLDAFDRTGFFFFICAANLRPSPPLTAKKKSTQQSWWGWHPTTLGNKRFATSGPPSLPTCRSEEHTSELQ